MMRIIDTKGRVTVPKPIRNALRLTSGTVVVFELDGRGHAVMHRPEPRLPRNLDRFEAARGKADMKWRTAKLMTLLRD